MGGTVEVLRPGDLHDDVDAGGVQDHRAQDAGLGLDGLGRDALESLGGAAAPATGAYSPRPDAFAVVIRPPWLLPRRPPASLALRGSVLVRQLHSAAGSDRIGRLQPDSGEAVQRLRRLPEPERPTRGSSLLTSSPNSNSTSYLSSRRMGESRTMFSVSTKTPCSARAATICAGPDRAVQVAFLVGPGGDGDLLAADGRGLGLQLGPLAGQFLEVALLLGLDGLEVALGGLDGQALGQQVVAGVAGLDVDDSRRSCPVSARFFEAALSCVVPRWS